MPESYVYPTSAELIAIAQDLMPRLMANRPIFDIMPVRDADEWTMMYEQFDNFVGVQAYRGLDGEPGRVKPVGLNRYEVTPGVYGEWIPVTEEELTKFRQPGTLGSAINITDLVLQRQNQLLERRLNRLELVGWSLLATGTYTVFTLNGGAMTVGKTDSYNIQTFTSGTGWSTAATSTPLADFRSMKLLHRGHSVDFGARAKAIMNLSTLNQMLINSNAADLYGRRTAGLATVNTLIAVNQIWTEDDLPTIQIYDESYLSDGTDGNVANSYVLYVPTGVVAVVGVRPAGQRVAEYRMTRNANNVDSAPGPYMRVIDTAEFKLPRNLQVHDGHNGGPIFFYPSAVVAGNVS
jgi:hypothetical protein